MRGPLQPAAATTFKTAFTHSPLTLTLAVAARRRALSLRTSSILNLNTTSTVSLCLLQQLAASLSELTRVKLVVAIRSLAATPAALRYRQEALMRSSALTADSQIQPDKQIQSSAPRQERQALMHLT